MSKPVIYLAGKMSGLTVEQMTEWRKRARNALYPHFEINDPCDQFLPDLNLKKLEKLSATDDRVTSREIVDSNKYRIYKSDILFVEMEHPETSIGTVGEIVYGAVYNKIIVVWGGSKTVQHPWIQDHITKHCKQFEDAVQYIKANFR